MVSIFDDMSLVTDDEVKRMLPLVDERRRNEALRYKHLFGQYSCLKSWLMLQELLKPLGINDLECGFNEHGKPFLKHYPDIHFNLSHCKNGIAVAVDNAPIGIDIECYRNIDDALIRKTMNGMADKSLRLVWPTAQRGAVVADYQHHGNLDYHEQQVEAGYALRATEWLQVGVAARYLHLGTSDGHYPAQQWVAAAALLQATVGDNTVLTLSGGSRPWDAVRPYRLHVQAQYRPLPQLLTVIEGESEERARLRLGMEYCYHEQFFLRTGLATHPMLFTFGLGFRQTHYAIDLAVEVHNALGLTPHTSLTLWF